MVHVDLIGIFFFLSLFLITFSHCPVLIFFIINLILYIPVYKLILADTQVHLFPVLHYAYINILIFPFANCTVSVSQHLSMVGK